jgi:hypothetical protein
MGPREINRQLVANMPDIKIIQNVLLINVIIPSDSNAIKKGD